MFKEIQSFWNGLSNYQIKLNLLSSEYWFSKAQVADYFHFLLIISLAIIILAILFKILYAKKHENNLIYSQFAGKIQTGLIIFSIIFVILVLFSNANTKYFGYRISYLFLLLIIFIWLTIINYYRYYKFEEKLVDYEKEERIKKYLPKRRKK